MPIIASTQNKSIAMWITIIRFTIYDSRFMNRKSNKIICESCFVNLKSISAVTIALFLIITNRADAGLILGAPKYVGLEKGLDPLEIRSAFSRPASRLAGLSLTGLVGYLSSVKI